MVGTSLLIAAGISAAAQAYGAHKASEAASEAGQAQATAAGQAADLQAPYRAAGLQALGQLQGMAPFEAPTNVTEQNDPGFQTRLQAAQQALERSAAARGTSLSGGSLKALTRYSQDYASNEYGNVYGRAASEYDRTRGSLAQLAGVGQQATAAQGEYLTQGANAQAAGQVGGANAWNGALGNIGNNLSFLALANQFNKPSATSAPQTSSNWGYSPWPGMRPEMAS